MHGLDKDFPFFRLTFLPEAMDTVTRVSSLSSSLSRCRWAYLSFSSHLSPLSVPILHLDLNQQFRKEEQTVRRDRLAVGVALKEEQRTILVRVPMRGIKIHHNPRVAVYTAGGEAEETETSGARESARDRNHTTGECVK